MKISCANSAKLGNTCVEANRSDGVPVSVWLMVGPGVWFCVGPWLVFCTPRVFCGVADWCCRRVRGTFNSAFNSMNVSRYHHRHLTATTREIIHHCVFVGSGPENTELMKRIIFGCCLRKSHCQPPASLYRCHYYRLAFRPVVSLESEHFRQVVTQNPPSHCLLFIRF
jgi:hypothetical protein